MSSNTTEHGEHFNESIVNEVILEDMKKNRIDHMKYLREWRQWKSPMLWNRSSQR